MKQRLFRDNAAARLVLFVRRFLLLGFLLPGLMAQSAWAEPYYVTDRLQLGVHAAADTSDRAFATLKSGDQVSILQEGLYYARVSMADGRKGWVKKNYLVPDKPAILVVTQTQKERDEARAQLASLKSSLGEREKNVAKMEKGLLADKAGLESDAAELIELRVDNEKLSNRLDAYGFSVPGNLFLLAIAACLAIGFLIAWYLFDHRSRLRHGGYRVH